MSYIPNQGDIVYLDFDPQAEHEQKCRRPALVVSNLTYNRLTKMALICPITNTNRHFPLHVPLNSQTSTSGFIMCEQVKALDINFRNAALHEQLPPSLMHEVFDIIFPIMFPLLPKALLPLGKVALTLPRSKGCDIRVI